MEIVELVAALNRYKQERPPGLLRKLLAGAVLLFADGDEREFKAEHVAGGVLHVGLHAAALRFPVSLSASVRDLLRCPCCSLNTPCSDSGRSTSADLERVPTCCSVSNCLLQALSMSAYFAPLGPLGICPCSIS